MGMDPCLNRSPALLATPVQINAQARAADELLPFKQGAISTVFVSTFTDFDYRCKVFPKKIDDKKKIKNQLTGCEELAVLCECVRMRVCELASPFFSLSCRS